MKKILAFVTLPFMWFSGTAQQGNDSGLMSGSERVWRYADKSVVATGTFLTARDGEVFIESSDVLYSVAVEDLYWKDQKYVQRRIKRIEALNAGPQVDENGQMTSIPEPRQSKSMQYIGWIALFMTLPVTIVFWMIKLTRKRSRKIAFGTSILLILLLAMACEPKNAPEAEASAGLFDQVSEPSTDEEETSYHGSSQTTLGESWQLQTRLQ